MQKRSFTLGIRERMIALILIPLVVILVLIAAFLQTQVLTILGEMKEENIQHQIDAAVSTVDAYFTPAFTAVNVLAETSSVQLRSMPEAPGMMSHSPYTSMILWTIWWALPASWVIVFFVPISVPISAR